jgi:hypothetical protein
MTFTSAPPNGSAIEVTTLSGSATSVANIANGTTVIDIPVVNGNATVSVGGNANVLTITSTGSNVTGTVSATGNITGANLVTAGAVTGNGRALTSLSATNIDTGTLDQALLANAAVTLGSTALTLGSTVTTVAGLSSVTSTTFVGALTGAATTAGTVTTAAQTNITSVGTLTALSVTGNITGGNLITAGLVSLSSITKTGSNGVGNIGAAASAFDTVFAKATSAQYADLAEIYTSDSEYPAGTVVVFGGNQEITASTKYAQPSVAGIISTNPAYLMNSACSGQPVALQGRVPCRVTGNICRGDLITSSEIPGVATRLDPADWKPGVVIGKALSNYNNSAEGIIEAVVGRV